MISFGSARHVNGFASVSLCSVMKRWIAACRSATELKAPYFSLRFVSLAKKPSTAFNHDADVGVK